jgi:hypothetical protein
MVRAYILGRQGLEPLHVTIVTGNHLPSALGHYYEAPLQAPKANWHALVLWRGDGAHE